MTTETGILICDAILYLAYGGVAVLGIWTVMHFDGRPRNL